MKAIKEVGTSNLFSNWRINGKAQFVDINQMAVQIAVFDDNVVNDTVRDLQKEGHDVIAVELVFDEQVKYSDEVENISIKEKINRATKLYFDALGEIQNDEGITDDIFTTIDELIDRIDNEVENIIESI